MDDPEEAMPPVKPGRSREVRVGRSATGKGVFARRWYRPNMVIGEIEGEVINDPHYGSAYCFDLEDGRFLEPTAPFRFLNHSCQSNCEFEVFNLLDGPDCIARKGIMLSALMDIGPGDELTIDYNWPLEGAIPCKCGAPRCRGWVVAATELAAVLALHAEEC